MTSRTAVQLGRSGQRDLLRELGGWQMQLDLGRRKAASPKLQRLLS